MPPSPNNSELKERERLLLIHYHPRSPEHKHQLFNLVPDYKMHPPPPHVFKANVWRRQGGGASYVIRSVRARELGIVLLYRDRAQGSLVG